MILLYGGDTDLLMCFPVLKPVHSPVDKAAFIGPDHLWANESYLPAHSSRSSADPPALPSS